MIRKAAAVWRRAGSAAHGDLSTESGVLSPVEPRSEPSTRHLTWG
jgi:hypothetical protein